MKKICLFVAIGILAVGLAGCKKTDEAAEGGAATPAGGMQAGETKSQGGAQGMSAPGDAMAAPPGVQTGTPGG